jgi:hypothetical protein
MRFAHNEGMKILIPSALCPVTERSRSELVEVLPSALFSYYHLTNNDSRDRG